MTNSTKANIDFPFYKWLPVIWMCMVLVNSYGQTGPFVNNTTYIQTALLQRPDLELSLPIIKLESGDQLTLRFDDLRGGVHDYSYTFVHCNADWQPSGLIAMDYLVGFETQFINDYQISFNTRQGYTQYTASFPNNQLNFLVSGNYLIQIWASDNDSIPILQMPFFIWEELAAINGKVQQPTLARFRNEYQRLMFEVDIRDVPGYNPYEEVVVAVMQNYQFNHTTIDLKPRLITNNTMLFDQTDFVFPGGKEFRRFDTRNIRLQSERVARIERDVTGNKAWINVDENRSYKRYSFDNDINGRFLIDAEQTIDKNVEADYVMVHFTLESPFWMSNGNYYVMGGFNHYQASDACKMEYDFDRQVYETDILLKQGYYNYQYAFFENGSEIPDYTMAEGNYFETMNDYTILVYWHDNLRNADKLVGYSILTSFPR